MSSSVVSDHPARSQLYIPGNRPDWMERALGYEVDELVIDLEDAVPTAEKAAALHQTSEFISGLGSSKPCWVRVSDIDGVQLLQELEMLVAAGAHGFVLPKVTDRTDVVVIDRLVGWLERQHGVGGGAVSLSPVLETAPALHFAHEIASSSPRIRSMGLSAPKGGDVARAVGYQWTPEGTETLAFRSMVLLALRAAGVPTILAGVWADVKDYEGLRAYAEAARRLGCDGMRVIHPSHLEIVHEVFAITQDEIDYHRGLLGALAIAEAEGRAAIQYAGGMIDIAMVETSKRVLARADAQRGMAGT